MDDLTVTRGSEWQKEAAGVVTRLPSGRVARLRDVDMDLLVEMGRLPDALTPLVIDAFKNPESNFALPEVETIDDLRERQKFRDAVVRCAFAEPRIVDVPTAEDEISLSAVSGSDRWFVLGLMLRPVHDLENFRDEQTADVDAVDVANGDEPPGVGDPEPAHVGKKKAPA